MSKEIVLELDGIDLDPQPDASWPLHYPKAEGEPPRAQPSRRRRAE